MGWRSTAVTLAITLALLAPAAEGCISPYGFEDFEPAPLIVSGLTPEMAPVDISASTTDDIFPKLVSYKGDLFAFWVKSTGTTTVSENLLTRARRDGQWGELLVVNNPNPYNGTLEGDLVRIGGFDVVVHDGLLYVIWCTADTTLTHGPDDDPVYRTFDGTRWSPVVELVPPDDGGEDVQPSAASTADGVLVAWTSSSPKWSNGTDQDIVVRLIAPGSSGPIVGLSPDDDYANDFIPEVTSTPLGTHVAWHTRSTPRVENRGGGESALTIEGRVLRDGQWSSIQEISGSHYGENLWIDTLWDGERLGLVWQRGGSDFAYRETRVAYREWDGEIYSPVQDLTSRLSGAHNGRPKLGIADGEVRVYWHTDDDAFTLGDSFDLVTRAREGDGYWAPLEVFIEDFDRDLLQVTLAPHDGSLQAAWITNVTYDNPPPIGQVQVWDVVVAPVYLPPNPFEGVSITHKWRRSLEAWGAQDRISFEVGKDGTPLNDLDLSVRVIDPEGRVEATLDGLTDPAGRADFDHVFESFGEYDLEVTLNGTTMGSLGVKVTPPPPGYVDSLMLTLAVLAAFVAILVAAGYLFIQRRGVKSSSRKAVEHEVPRRTPWLWRQASRALTKVVKSSRAQGFLQIPLFALFIVSIILGYLGTQDPQANFTTMLGWVYYLPGMLVLYAFFGRLWCYVEACGFVDTWVKRLMRRRIWREWPSWLQNLWPGFVLLLAGFWVEIVFSIDLYPWAVATFMTAVILINLGVSANYGKRTYCRFVCRDGVVEELIARFSLFKISVKNQADSVSHGASCIWKEEEKRPGYCSMCFTCVQNNPDVKEATVRPMVKNFAKDVYKPRAVHRDEAMAAILLMGISIPYMAVLTRAWWVDLADIAIGMGVPLGAINLTFAGVFLTVGVALLDRWAFRRWPGTFTPPKRVLTVLLEGLLISQVFLIALGGEVGRLIAVRSVFVLGCFVLPYAFVWVGERLVVRLTRNVRGEPAGTLLARYALIFIPVFVGVLIARNIPIVATWGWAAWDIVVATATEFPTGAAAVTPRPFVDPSYHFGLGVASLAFGVALGAYTALQISRRLYKSRMDAFRAFAVHTAMLSVLGGLFVAILALPPF
jgi:hypothetical protein